MFAITLRMYNVSASGGSRAGRYGNRSKIKAKGNKPNGRENSYRLPKNADRMGVAFIISFIFMLIPIDPGGIITM